MGTLRFGTWKAEFDSQEDGTVEDWGVAFEGLPMDCRLFPAVGLYQRDDQATLLDVEDPRSGGPRNISGGDNYFPSDTNKEDPEKIDRIARIRAYNSFLAWEGVNYCAWFLSQISQHPEDVAACDRKIFPSLVASLCVMPSSVPCLSVRSALALMPHIHNCIGALYSEDREASIGGPCSLREGEWVIRATCGSSDLEEYIVAIKARGNSSKEDGFEGEGVGTTGKSKNGVVSIVGTMIGTTVTFVEEWSEASSSDVSSCLISARCSLDGSEFTGSYRNAQFGTVGQITGSWRGDSPDGVQGPLGDDMQTGRLLLCAAHSHLATVVTEGPRGTDPVTFESDFAEKALARSHLGNCFLSISKEDVLESIRVQFQIPRKHLVENVQSFVFLESLNNGETLSDLGVSHPSTLTEQVNELDNEMVQLSGGRGSLRGLSSSNYDDTRKSIVVAGLHLMRTTIVIDIDRALLVAIWRTALKINEDSVRKAISVTNTGTKRSSSESALGLLRAGADFLGQLVVTKRAVATDEILNDLAWFFAHLRNPSDLHDMKRAMSNASQMTVMRLVGINATHALLASPRLRPSPRSLEYIVAGIPRILGRGQQFAKNQTPSHLELDGRPTAGLDGADAALLRELGSSISETFVTMIDLSSEMMERRSQLPSQESSIDSLTVATLACFIGSFRMNFDELGSPFLQLAKQYLSAYPEAFHDEAKQSSTDVDNVAFICDIVKRENSRLILRHTLASVHVFLYNLQRSDSIADFESTRSCLNWVCSEFSTILPFLQRRCGENRSSTVEKTADAEILRFSLVTDKKPKDEEKVAKPRFQSAIDFLGEHGIAPFSQSNQTQPKPSSRKSSSSDPSSGARRKREMSFSAQFLSQWIHVVSGIFSCETKAEVVSDLRWLSVLFESLGLTIHFEDASIVDIEENSQTDLLPARQRSRIILLLQSLLEVVEPNPFIVRGLLLLAGSDIDRSEAHKFNYLVAREAVSTMRHLYSPERKAWRKCINESIEAVARGDTSQGGARAGIVAFLNGTVQGMAVLSLVLLKPSMSISLFQDQQQTASTKGSGSMSGRVAPVGTESVACGLLRSGADAGIISNIDVRNGICEVILMSRGSEQQQQNVVEQGQNISPGRPSLTVRALRAPLKDVSVAQEFSLCLDDSLPVDNILGNMLEDSLDSLLLSATTDGRKDSISIASGSPVGANDNECHETEFTERIWEGLSRRTLDLMTVKGCISVLSDEKLSNKFLTSKHYHRCREKVLALAWPDTTESCTGTGYFRTALADSLSTIAAREARYHFAIEALKELDFRSLAIKQFSGKLEESENSDEKDTNSSSPEDKEACISGSRNTSSGSMPSTGITDLSPQPPLAGTSGSSGRDLDSTSNRSISQSTGGSNSDDDEEGDDRSDAASTSLREAAIAQMAELGIPRQYSEFALRRTGGTIEAAVHFCLEHGTDIERMLAEEMERQSTHRSSGRRPAREDGHLLRQLLEMGFRRRWCTEALSATGYNVDDALTWILNNNDVLERLGDSDEEDDEEEEDAEAEDDGDSDEDSQTVDEEMDKGIAKAEEAIETIAVWKGSVCPLSVISGHASIDSSSLEISGLSNGGFASVGMKGILLKHGKWYYEVVLGTAGCIQVGFGDSTFAIHCNADRGDGCGDSSSSFGFDGWRRLRWNGTATEWGCRWEEGDTIGCLLDLESRQISFSLNGMYEEVGMGIAFSEFSYSSGLFPVVSFNRREKLRLILGGNQPFRFPPPEGYRGVGEAVLQAVEDRKILLREEIPLDPEETNEVQGKFLRDLSDEDHGHELFSWPHRYYGSDASVHLGSTRPKVPMSTSSVDSIGHGMVASRTDKAWRSLSSDDSLRSAEKIQRGYAMLRQELQEEIMRESIALAVVVSRKLLMHLLVSGVDFAVQCFSSDRDQISKTAQKLWKVFEASLSLRSWSGEAGAMAVAAEALGLGIQMQSRQSGLGAGSLASAGCTQVLASIGQCSSAQLARCTGTSFASAAEAAFGSEDGGASLAFTRDGLQKAAWSCRELRDVLVAAIYRSVRLLAGIDENEPASGTVSHQTRRSIWTL